VKCHFTACCLQVKVEQTKYGAFSGTAFADNPQHLVIVHIKVDAVAGHH
jgi:hypothetical protein